MPETMTRDMNIKLPPDALEKAINENVGRAVEDALGSYKIRTAIEETIAESVVMGAIREAIERAVEALDTENLSTVLAEQIEQTATKATVAILRDGFADVVARLRGVKEYQDDYDERMARIRAELDFGR